MHHLAPPPRPRPAQDPTPAQLAAWKRLHGYAGTPLPDHVEAYLQAESKPHRQAAQPSTPAQDLEFFGKYTPPPPNPDETDLDLWPAIKRLYLGLGLVGLVAVVAVFWSRFA